MSEEPVDIMLVDSRAVVREGLCAVIEQQPDLVVVAQAGAVGDVVAFDVVPDVIVTDVRLPDARSSAVIKALRGYFARSAILAFTRVGDPVEVQSVLAAGANGYLLESAPTSELIAGIRAVAGGEIYLQPSLGVELARLQRPRDATLGLSVQEEHVLRLLVLGHTNAEVARLCGVSLRTAEAHRAHIQRKLGRRTRAALVEFARENGLVDLAQNGDSSMLHS